MLQLAIVESDQSQAERLAELINASPLSSNLEVHILQSVSELEGYLAANRLDILFMSVILTDQEDQRKLTETGIHAVARLFTRNTGTQVIYMSAYDNFYEQAYETRHVYFLKKPLSQDRVNKALERALFELRTTAPPPLEISAKGVLYTLPVRKIRYIESDRRKVRIAAGEKIIEAYASLEDLALRLPAQFVRCHKGFLVNMDYVEELGKSDLLLITGESIPLSQRKHAEVREGLHDYIADRI